MTLFHNKYWACSKIALQKQLRERGQLMGRVFLYVIIVYLFSQVFESVGAPIPRIWYLAITEWLILSTPPLAIQIAEDIQSGQIVYFMVRPMSYLSLRLWESLGGIVVRFILLGVTCLSLGFSLTGVFPGNGVTWGLGALFGMLGVFLYTLLLVLIGLLSFWIREIKSIMYLNLTATFCFGGLIVPLSFYSETFRKISFATPYPWILWGPAEYITGTGLNLVFALLGWGVWVLLLSACILILYRRCLNSFVVEGG